MGVVGPVKPTAGDTKLWGITFNCEDLDRTHNVLKDCTQPPWNAVQPGRRITTLQREKRKDVSLALAFMSRHVKDVTPMQDRNAKYAANARAQEDELAAR